MIAKPINDLTQFFNIVVDEKYKGEDKNESKIVLFGNAPSTFCDEEPFLNVIKRVKKVITKPENVSEEFAISVLIELSDLPKFISMPYFLQTRKTANAIISPRK